MQRPRPGPAPGRERLRHRNRPGGSGGRNQNHPEFLLPIYHLDGDKHPHSQRSGAGGCWAVVGIRALVRDRFDDMTIMGPADHAGRGGRGRSEGGREGAHVQSRVPGWPVVCLPGACSFQ